MDAMNQCAQERGYSEPQMVGRADGMTAGACLGGSNSNSLKRPIGFSFGDALERVKQGRRMSRHGWNGPGQFIFVVYGSDPSNPGERAPLLSGVKADLFAFGDRGTTRRLPHVALHNTRGESVPWAPSQSDMLAEDWYPV